MFIKKCIKGPKCFRNELHSNKILLLNDLTKGFCPLKNNLGICCLRKLHLFPLNLFRCI